MNIVLCEHQLEVVDLFSHQTNCFIYKNLRSMHKVDLFEQNVTENIRPKNGT